MSAPTVKFNKVVLYFMDQQKVTIWMINLADFPILKGHNSCKDSAIIVKITLDLYFVINNNYMLK
jgi:hypothetical protein